MSSIEFPEWLNANSTRAYPLSEAGSRTSTSGGIQIPDTLIVAAQINVPFSYKDGVFHVSEVTSLPDKVSVTIAYHDGSESSEVATVTADAGTHSTNTAYAFVGTGTHGAVIGKLTLGKIDDLLSQVAGTYAYDEEGAPFEISVLFISQPAVEAMQILEDGEVVSTLTGAVKFKAGSNVRLTRLADNTIRFDAIEGENLDDCGEEDQPPIRTINGVGPDEDGDLRLDGSECVSITLGGANTLRIIDLCSESCCGCDELSVVVDSLKKLDQQRSELRTLVFRAENEHANMIANLTRHLQ